MPRAAKGEGPVAGPRRSAGARRAAEGWGLGAAEGSVDARLTAWNELDAGRRVWEKDPAFWPQAPAADVAGRLGWLRAPEESGALAVELKGLVEEVRSEPTAHVVLLGMGGSSLAAEVMALGLPRSEGFPPLTVLDTTHPAAVGTALELHPVDRTLFVVSSKSGTTLEPNAFFRRFWEQTAKRVTDPGRRFVAITDPGTPLEQLARDRHFRRCFLAPADVGGRYSALTAFGLVPAALTGVDIERVLASARAMASRCGPAVPVRLNPGLRLAAALGELGRGGRDKILFLPTPSLRHFPAWAEQLLAESLGKAGRGLVPVADPPPPGEYPRGSDVVYVLLAARGEHEPEVEASVALKAAEGAPVLRFEFEGPWSLGAEFFRWEFAVASCGTVLEVDPFDQPDVERAKELARQAMKRPRARSGRAPGYGDPVGDLGPGALGPWLASVLPGTYVALQAFLAPSPEADRGLREVAGTIRRRLGVPVTVGYGPRFLHSTGQLHKGGPPSGRFLQLVDEPTTDLTVPGLGLSFAEILRAQASGDRTALEENHRQIRVVNLGRDVPAGLRSLAAVLEGPLR